MWMMLNAREMALVLQAKTHAGIFPDGPHSVLLTLIQGKLERDGSLELTADELAGVRRAVRHYYQHSHQKAFEAILSAALRH